MKGRELFTCRGAYAAMLLGLSLIALSLCICALYLRCPPLYDSEARRWLLLHFALTFDTVVASALMTLGGAFLLEFTYRKEKRG